MSSFRPSLSRSIFCYSIFYSSLLLLLITIPHTFCAVAHGESTTSAPPANSSSSSHSSCPTCPDCKPFQDLVAIHEERAGKLQDEVRHLRVTNEESVRASHSVSEKQVASLSECHNAQKALGESFNASQMEKLELIGKVEEMQREGVEKEVEFEKKLQSLSAVSASSTELQEKLQRAEVQVVELKTKAKEDSASLAALQSERQNVQLITEQLAAATSESAKLQANVKKAEAEAKKAEAEAKKAEAEAKKTEAAGASQLSTLKEKLRSLEQSAESTSRRLAAEMEGLQAKMSASADDGFIYSWGSFSKSMSSVWVLCRSVYGYLLQRVPQSTYDRLHETYVEYRVGFFDPNWERMQPHYATLRGISLPYWQGLQRFYFQFVHSIVSAQYDNAKAKGKALRRLLSSKKEALNASVDSHLIRPLVKFDPQVEALIPRWSGDRLMCLLFLLVVFFVAMRLGMMALRSTVLPLLRFAVCRVALCGLCLRRRGGGDESGKRGSSSSSHHHHTKKKGSSSSSGSSGSSSSSSSKDREARKKSSSGSSSTSTGSSSASASAAYGAAAAAPTSGRSAGSSSGIRSFRPDGESAGGVTTTSSSTGSLAARKK